MLGILLGLICLAFLTYKGMSILWVAPVSALVVAGILVNGRESEPAK